MGGGETADFARLGRSLGRLLGWLGATEGGGLCFSLLFLKLFGKTY
jgi:hypothetical protein